MRKTKKQTVQGVMEASRYKMTIKEVAQGARVSVSTARRYLEILEFKGVVVKTVQARGGYSWILTKYLDEYHDNKTKQKEEEVGPQLNRRNAEEAMKRALAIEENPVPQLDRRNAEEAMKRALVIEENPVGGIRHAET